MVGQGPFTKIVDISSYIIYTIYIYIPTVAGFLGTGKHGNLQQGVFHGCILMSGNQCSLTIHEGAKGGL